MNPITAGAQFRMLSNKTKIRIQLAAWVALLLAAGAVVISTAAFGISGKGDAIYPEKSADLGRSTAFGRKLAAWLCGGIGGVSGNVPSMDCTSSHHRRYHGVWNGARNDGCMVWQCDWCKYMFCSVQSTVLQKKSMFTFAICCAALGQYWLCCSAFFVPKCRWYSRLSDGLWRTAMETMVFGYRCR